MRRGWKEETTSFPLAQEDFTNACAILLQGVFHGSRSPAGLKKKSPSRIGGLPKCTLLGLVDLKKETNNRFSRLQVMVPVSNLHIWLFLGFWKMRNLLFCFMDVIIFPKKCTRKTGKPVIIVYDLWFYAPSHTPIFWGCQIGSWCLCSKMGQGCPAKHGERLCAYVPDRIGMNWEDVQ